MADESLFLTTHEAALAVVATSMKKARQLILTLTINSFMGGLLFTTGGMLHVMVELELPEIFNTNPGFVYLLQGLVYPIGLFYVVVMGVDLFNSNILFFTVGVVRGAVSVLDLAISLIVSWWLNLVGNIFVCYLMCHYSGVTSTEAWKVGSVRILETKLCLTFVETLIKGMVGNFYVCLAIYLQLMAKPIHVKLIVMTLPIFTFVSLGFTHSVADMFMIIIGLINNAPVSVGTCAWKLFLPGALGNLIGGGFFSLVIPWYLHLVVVERDQKELNLPRYEMRDEQPELNQDSRVVRVPARDEELEDIDEIMDDSFEKPNVQDTDSRPPLVHVQTGMSTRSGLTIRSRQKKKKSPRNVFPVYGMGGVGAHERSLAYGEDADDDDQVSAEAPKRSASFISNRLWRTMSRKPLSPDLESQNPNTDTASINIGSMNPRFPRYSIGGLRRASLSVDPANAPTTGPINFKESGISVPESLLSNLTAAVNASGALDVRPYDPKND